MHFSYTNSYPPSDNTTGINNEMENTTMVLDEQVQTVQEEAGGEDSEPDIWEDLGSGKATSRAPSTNIGGWEMLTADEQVMVAEAVVVNYQLACFEFYQKNSLWRPLSVLMMITRLCAVCSTQERGELE
jgi:hypothetical protein